MVERPVTVDECLDQIERAIGSGAPYEDVARAIESCSALPDAADRAHGSARIRLAVVRHYERPLAECEAALNAFAALPLPPEERAAPIIAMCNHAPDLAPAWLPALVRELDGNPDLEVLRADAVAAMGAAVDSLADDAQTAFAAAMRALTIGREYASTCTLLDAIEVKYVVPFLAMGAYEHARALRVRCAYGRLCAAMEGHTLDRCEIHLARLLALLPADWIARPAKLCAFAGHAIAKGDPARARIYLVPLIEELEGARERFPGDEDIEHSLGFARNVLARAMPATDKP